MVSETPFLGVGMLGFDFVEAQRAQQRRGGSRPAPAAAMVEMLPKREKGTLRWFNANKESGFVSPDNGGGYLYFHQSSLKSDERDDYHSLNVGDSVEFEIRADWDGRPRAFDITTPGGCALTSGFHPDGCDGCGSDASYDEGDLGCSGDSGYDFRGCYSCGKDDDAAPVLPEGTALQMFDEMLPSAVVWDEGIGHEVSFSGGLLEQLAQGAEYMLDEEQELVGKPEFSEEISSYSSAGLQKVAMDVGLQQLAIDTGYLVQERYSEVVWDEDLQDDHVQIGISLDQLVQSDDWKPLALHPMLRDPVVNGAAREEFDKLSPSSAVWDEELSGNLDSYGGLLQQLAVGEESFGDKTLTAAALTVNNMLSIVNGSSFSLELEVPDIDFVVDGMHIKSEKQVLMHGSFGQWSKPNCLLLRKSLAWRRNGFSPGPIEHNHEMCIKIGSQAYREFILQTVPEQYDIRDGHSMIFFAGRHAYDVRMCELYLKQPVLEKQPWLYGGFSLGEGDGDEQPKIHTKVNCSIRQWDPGIINPIPIYTKSEMVVPSVMGVQFRRERDIQFVTRGSLIYAVISSEGCALQYDSASENFWAIIRNIAASIDTSSIRIVWGPKELILLVLQMIPATYLRIQASLSCSMRHEVAWGQATFRRGGSVTHGHNIYRLVLSLRHHGPAQGPVQNQLYKEAEHWGMADKKIFRIGLSPCRRLPHRRGAIPVSIVEIPHAAGSSPPVATGISYRSRRRDISRE